MFFFYRTRTFTLPYSLHRRVNISKPKMGYTLLGAVRVSTLSLSSDFCLLLKKYCFAVSLATVTRDDSSFRYLTVMQCALCLRLMQNAVAVVSSPGASLRYVQWRSSDQLLAFARALVFERNRRDTHGELVQKMRFS